MDIITRRIMNELEKQKRVQEDLTETINQTALTTEYMSCLQEINNEIGEEV